MRFPDIAVLTLLLVVSAGAQPASIELSNGAFQVRGWSAPKSPPAGDWSPIFAVYTGTAGANEKDAPPLIGTYTVESGVLVFRPKYPFAPGMRYRAVFHPPGSRAPVERTFDGPPKPTTSLARVENVYPSAAVWPANLLRVYICFSASMSHGEAAARIHMLDANGKLLPGVFLPGEELWDPAGTRLTMTLDPGRIKRGLTANMAMGPPIAEGKLYTLVIDREWPDARGVAMIEGFRKPFRGGPAERVPPDPPTWRITAPKAGSSEALTIAFPKPMNYALLQRMLQVASEYGSVPGVVTTAEAETRWRYTPKTPWKQGAYRLVVDTAIEDLAGNSIGRPFDIDVFARVTQHITARTISLPFRIQ